MVRGECLPLAGTLPLLPVVQALRELGRLEGGRLLEEGLAAAPAYVRVEVGRLLPQLGPGDGTAPGGRGGGWRRERLFSAVAELLDAVAGGAAGGAGLVVEDVHWADGATLDLLTFLARAGCGDAVTVVATCRGDEAPLAAPVAGWLAHVRGAAGVEEIGLGPLSRPEVAGQVAALAGGPVPEPVVDELYARAEGNPFFTEQLVAAALASARAAIADPGWVAGPAGRAAGGAGRPLRRGCPGGAGGAGGRGPAADRGPARRGQRAGRRGGAAGAAAAGRGPAARRGCSRWGAPAAACAAGRGGGRRAAARRAGDAARAHRAGAGGRRGPGAGRGGGRALAGRGPPCRGAARAGGGGRAAERVFGYAEAAAHWERAIELCQALPAAAGTAGASLPQLYLRAIDAADYPATPSTPACWPRKPTAGSPVTPTTPTPRSSASAPGYLRDLHTPGAGGPLMERALELFELGPPSAEHAEALLQYARTFSGACGRWEASGGAAPGIGDRRSGRCHGRDFPHPRQNPARSGHPQPVQEK